MTRAVGVGLHSGQRVELTLRPAPADTGIVFRRVDLPQPVDIPMRPQAVTDTRLASTISGGRRQGADRRAPDVGLRRPGHRQPRTSTSRPTRCRSSTARRRRSCSCCKAPASSCRRRRAASSACSSRSRCAKARATKLKWARLEPYHGYKLSFEIDFDHRVVDSTGQRVEFDLGTGSYSRDIARARTFGFTKDVETMRSNGLALGGGLDNAIVMDDYQGAQRRRPALRRRVRQAQDPRRHGRPVPGRQAAAGRLQRLPLGHALNNKLLRELLADRGRLRGRHLRRRARGARRLRRPRGPGRRAPHAPGGAMIILLRPGLRRAADCRRVLRGLATRATRARRHRGSAWPNGLLIADAGRCSRSCCCRWSSRGTERMVVFDWVMGLLTAATFAAVGRVACCCTRSPCEAGCLRRSRTPFDWAKLFGLLGVKHRDLGPRRGGAVAAVLNGSRARIQ